MAGNSSTLGYDLSAVSAHTGPGAGAASRAIGASAYTGGSDIHVGGGSAQALPHEAWHVAQQRTAPAKPADIQAAVGHYAR